MAIHGAKGILAHEDSFRLSIRPISPLVMRKVNIPQLHGFVIPSRQERITLRGEANSTHKSLVTPNCKQRLPRRKKKKRRGNVVVFYFYYLLLFYFNFNFALTVLTNPTHEAL
jgi:hypothetical protein